eukprot:10415500-Lingulodinium_polyedra.AAC.1
MLGWHTALGNVGVVDNEVQRKLIELVALNGFLTDPAVNPSAQPLVVQVPNPVLVGEAYTSVTIHKRLLGGGGVAYVKGWRRAIVEIF